LARHAPADPCALTFAEGLSLGEAAEVALEDYARVVSAAPGAEVVKDEAEERVTGVRLLGPGERPSPEACRDIEDFARGLAAEHGGWGLGWA
jgi:hypothetical protein